MDTPVTVYNFEVEDFHTYYVSEQKVLVHNTCAATEKNLSTNRKAEILRENRIRGAAYEKEKYAEFSKVHSHSAEQVTIRTASGTKIRVDAIGYDAEGKLIIQEFKSSQSAGFTKKQKKAFPELAKTGGIVVGREKGKFKGGDVIPATYGQALRSVLMMNSFGIL